MQSSPGWILYSVACIVGGIVLIAVTGGRWGIVIVVGGVAMAVMRLRQARR
jgi:hypothetical protein